MTEVLVGDITRLAVDVIVGAYGFPKQRAASIAVREMQTFESRFERVVACCFSEGDTSFYRPLLS